MDVGVAVDDMLREVCNGRTVEMGLLELFRYERFVIGNERNYIVEDAIHLKVYVVQLNKRIMLCIDAYHPAGIHVGSYAKCKEDNTSPDGNYP